MYICYILVFIHKNMNIYIYIYIYIHCLPYVLSKLGDPIEGIICIYIIYICLLNIYVTCMYSYACIYIYTYIYIYVVFPMSFPNWVTLLNASSVYTSYIYVRYIICVYVIYMYSCIQMYIYTHTYIYIYICVVFPISFPNWVTLLNASSVYSSYMTTQEIICISVICMYSKICKYLYIYIYIYIYIRIQIYKDICIYIYM
jgi:hypothetical protein